jgi:hypothetical protein
MKSQRTQFTGILALFAIALLNAGSLQAQDVTSSSSAPNNAGTPSESIQGGTSSSDASWTGANREFILVGSDRQVSLNPLLKYQFIYGMDLTQGYDNGLILFPSTVGVHYTLATPRVGVIGRTAKSQYIVQYTPTLSYFNNAGPSGIQAYHQGVVEMHTEVNRTWGWDFKTTAEYGTYPLSLLSNFSFVSLEGVTAVDPNSILLLTNTGYFNTDASIGLHWHASPRDTFTLSSVYDYSNFPADSSVPGSVPGHVHRDTVLGTYSRSVTRRFSLLANGNALHVFGPLSCTTYGGQFGASYEIRRGTTVSATAGPQFGNGGCTASVLLTYSGYVSTRLSRSWEGYLTAERTSSSAIHSALGSGLTETYGAGISRTLNGKLIMRLDGGYIRVSALPGLPDSYSADGKFITPQIGWALSRSMDLTLRYSRIYQVVTGTNLDRDQAAVTLRWHPTSKGAF